MPAKQQQPIGFLDFWASTYVKRAHYFDVLSWGFCLVTKLIPFFIFTRRKFHKIWDIFRKKMLCSVFSSLHCPPFFKCIDTIWIHNSNANIFAGWIQCTNTLNKAFGRLQFIEMEKKKEKEKEEKWIVNAKFNRKCWMENLYRKRNMTQLERITRR